MNVQLASESSFLTEQVQKQILSLDNSKVYLFTDIKYVGVITKQGEFSASAGSWLQRTIESDLLRNPKCQTYI